MLEYELYQKINQDLKVHFTNKLSQKEALVKIADKWKIHKRFFPRLKIIIAVAYCVAGKEKSNTLK